jgi:predicted nucleic acid-binding protein
VIVVDASCLVELLLGLTKSEGIAERLSQSEADPCAPCLVDIEFCHAARRLWLAGHVSASRAEQAIEDLIALRLVRFAHEELLQAVWRLRSSLTAYDATYVALAIALDASLATSDKKLAAAAGRHVRVELF